MDRSRLERRLRTSGVLVLAGLAVELATLFSSHPTAFLLFIFPGSVLLLIGIVMFLLSLLTAGETTKPQ